MATDRRAEQDGETLCRYACKLGLEVLNRTLEEQAKATARELPEFFSSLRQFDPVAPVFAVTPHYQFTA